MYLEHRLAEAVLGVLGVVVGKTRVLVDCLVVLRLNLLPPWVEGEVVGWLALEVMG